jgi:exosortase A-associated hydrolase 1
MSAHTEIAQTFSSGAHTLVGILSSPAPGATAPTTGIVIIVGGPQYRAGSHRQFVLLARALASAGHPVLRFDIAGMGDSEGEQQNFETASADIRASIDHLQRHTPSLTKIVLWGLCDGASAALLYLQDGRDSRVAGLCLLNPWVRSAESLARTQVKHYYFERLQQREFWSKLLRGKVAVDAAKGFVGNLSVAIQGKKTAKVSNASRNYQQKMAHAWQHFEGEILLILSGNDYTAKEFLEYIQTHSEWATALQHRHLERIDLADADHTFSHTPDRIAVENQTLGWLQKIAANVQGTAKLQQ